MQYFVTRRGFPTMDVGQSAQVIHASYLDKEEFMHMPRAFHKHENVFELVLALSGSSLVIIDGIPYTARQGDIIIYNKHSYHQECTDQSRGFSLYCVAAAGIKIPGLPEDCVAGKNIPKVIHTGKDFDFFKMLFSRIFDMVRINDIQKVNLLDDYLHVLLGEVIPRCDPPDDYAYSASSGKAMIADQVYKWLSGHYTEKITLQDVADALSLSPDYVSHVFKDQFQYSPMHYVNVLRIGQAQLRLIETTDKISDIAMDVGFNNIGNFNRAFLDLVGLTPREFRKTHTALKEDYDSRDIKAETKKA